MVELNTTRRYWAIRTTRDNELVRKLILDNIVKGILRQGWGYDESQNLLKIEEKVINNIALNETERVSWRGNRKLLESQGGIKKGDIVLLMNVPEDGKLFIVEVTGSYSFSPIKLNVEQDRWELGQDFGHKIDIKSIDNFRPRFMQDVIFSADLRRSFTCRSRMWCLDDHADCIELTINQNTESKLFDVNQVFGELILDSINAAKQTILSKLEDTLMQKITRGEFETPCKIALERFFPCPYFQIEHVAGAGENGADIVIKWSDPFQDFDFCKSENVLSSAVSGCYVVQVKNWTGVCHDTHAVDQIKGAKAYYESESPVRAGYIFTLCDSESKDFENYRKEVQSSLKIPIYFVGKSDMLKILCEYATTKFGINNTLI